MDVCISCVLRTAFFFSVVCWLWLTVLRGKAFDGARVPVRPRNHPLCSHLSYGSPPGVKRGTYAPTVRSLELHPRFVAETDAEVETESETKTETEIESETESEPKSRTNPNPKPKLIPNRNQNRS